MKIKVFLLTLFFLIPFKVGSEVEFVKRGYFNNLADISLYSKSPDTLEDILKKYHQESGHELLIVTGRLPFGATAKDLAERAYKEWGVKNGAVLAVAIVPDTNATFSTYFHNEAYIYVSDDLKEKIKKGETEKIIKKIVLPWLSGRESFMAFFNGAHEIIQLISAREKKPFDFTQVWGLTDYDIEKLIPLKMGFLDRLIDVLEWIAAIVVLIIIVFFGRRGTSSKDDDDD